MQIILLIILSIIGVYVRAEVLKRLGNGCKLTSRSVQACNKGGAPPC
jgi:hypothetical protein